MSADSDNLSLQVEQKAVSKADYLAMKAKYILAKTKSAENFLQNSPINHGDIQSTWVRLIQVFTNVWANFRQGLSTLKASDKDNPNAFFNKMMHGTKYIVTSLPSDNKAPTPMVMTFTVINAAPVNAAVKPTAQSATNQANQYTID